MAKRYSIAEARQNLPQLVHEAEAGIPIELTRRGEPVAIVLSLEEYQRLKEQRGESFWEGYQRWRREHDVDNLGIEPEDVFKDVRDRSPGREFSWE